MSRHQHNSTKNIKAAFFLNLAFTLLEIIGGLYINSIAILSDALHDLGDSFSLGLSWFLDKYSRKQGNEKYSYGYRRYSLLAALINTSVLIVGSVFILSEAIPRLFDPEYANAGGMILLAVIGILVNGLAVLRLRGGASLNEKVVTWHLLEDVFGWGAVFIGGILMYFWDIPILDPILSLGITLFILFNVIRNFKKTLSVFLQAVPEGINLEEIREKFLNIEGVLDLHHTHIWSLDSEHHVLSTHLVVEESAGLEEIKKIKSQAKERIADVNFEHITLEIETLEEYCALRDPTHGPPEDRTC